MEEVQREPRIAANALGTGGEEGMINVHEEEEDEGGIDIEGTLLPRARQRPPPREEGARRLPGRGGMIVVDIRRRSAAEGG